MNANLSRAVRGALIFAGLLLPLSACNNGSSQSGPPVGPTTAPGCGTATPNTRVYVTDGQLSNSSNPTNNPNTVDVFTMSSIISGGNTINPCAQINSPNFSTAYGIAVDSEADIYLTDQASSTVLEFAASANGASVTPTRTFTSTNMGGPYGIALDGAGNIYVSAQGSGTSSNPNGAIFVFAPTASGTATPLRVIAGSKTGLDKPAGIAISSQTLYVTNQTDSTVLTFPISANGNVKPTRTITGGTSGLNNPIGIAVRGGAIYVSNVGASSGQGQGSITVYSAAGTSSTPIRTITSASSSGLFGPAGLAVDSSARLWVGELGPTNSSSNPTGTLAVYPPNANGSVSPTAAVAGVGFAAWGVALF